MPINILMPALSPTMEEGNLAKWHVNEGDAVSAGDVIAEIETDKATMEIEAVDDGTIGKIVIGEGSEGVKINEVIAIMLEEGEEKGEIDVSKIKAPSKTESKKVEQIDQKPVIEATPRSNGTKPTSPIGTEKNVSRIFASPLARRLASLNGLDLSTLTGTGPRGRVIKRDIEAAAKSGGGSSTIQTGSLSKTGSDDPMLKLFEEGSFELIPHDNMRKTIAKRLTESKQNVPHFYLTVDCEIDALLALRADMNEFAPIDSNGNPEYKVSVNDMVIKAHAMALKAVPEANSSWTDAGIAIHRNVDVGVAVAIKGGLITPIIRKAEEKSISEIGNEMKDLANRARERKLLPHEYQGGSTAISNLGMFGIKEFSAVINPPHATILAVGAGLQQAVVKDGQISPATIMTVTLSTDHRAVDGALGANLLKEFKKLVERPHRMLL